MNRRSHPAGQGHERDEVRRLLGLPRVAPVEFVDSGWVSRVYLVLLPRVLEAHQDYDYVVYEGVVGVGLDVAGLDEAGLDDAAWRSLGTALGSFLRRMHALELPQAPRVTVEEEVAQLRRAYLLSRDAIEAELGADRTAALDSLTRAELPSLLLGLGYDPALCHGDLGPWNMILTPERRLGVIDFGDVGRWDRSKDFMALGAPMLEAALAAYGDDEHLRRKVAVRHQVLQFLDLPYYLGTRDVERAGRTMSRIADLLAERA